MSMSSIQRKFASNYVRLLLQNSIVGLEVLNLWVGIGFPVAGGLKIGVLNFAFEDM